jgi:putative endonuclease
LNYICHPFFIARVANLPAGRIGRRKFLIMFFVYAINSCVRPYFYVGMTNDVKRRLLEHNKGENKSTKAYVPFELIFKEEHQTRIEARTREKYLKSGVGKEYLKCLLK